MTTPTNAWLAARKVELSDERYNAEVTLRHLVLDIERELLSGAASLGDRALKASLAAAERDLKAAEERRPVIEAAKRRQEVRQGRRTELIPILLELPNRLFEAIDPEEQATIELQLDTARAELDSLTKATADDARVLEQFLNEKPALQDVVPKLHRAMESPRTVLGRFSRWARLRRAVGPLGALVALGAAFAEVRIFPNQRQSWAIFALLFGVGYFLLDPLIDRIKLRVTLWVARNVLAWAEQLSAELAVLEGKVVAIEREIG